MIVAHPFPAPGGVGKMRSTIYLVATFGRFIAPRLAGLYLAIQCGRFLLQAIKHAGQLAGMVCIDLRSAARKRNRHVVDIPFAVRA